MLQTRPLSGSPVRHVLRERLLRLLPDAPGHVVWLHAPLGYGKSMLASQWAEGLETAGWRVLWTAMSGSGVQQTVAEALRLPAAAPWAVIAAELGREATLLVVEDLKGDEQLEELLRANRLGLTLLASRTGLAEPELLRLRTHGRLLELQAEQLAFTLAEAEQLGEELDTAEVTGQWQRTGGWPLLLHFALLTGDSGNGPLHELLKRSVSGPAWQEALFLAAAGTIDRSAGNAHTEELASGGFLQRLERHYRLHPLLADSLLANQGPAVREQLRRELDRLQRMDRLRACQRASHPELLASELDSTPLLVAGENSSEYLRLSAANPAADSDRRRLRDAYARMSKEASASHAVQLQEVLASGSLPADELFDARVVTAVMLARIGSHAEATQTIEQAQAGLGDAPSLELTRALAAQVLIEGYAGRFERALQIAERAHAMGIALGSEEGRIQAAMAQQHAGTFRFELSGDAETEARIFQELAADSRLDKWRRSQLQFNVAVNLVMDLQDEAAAETARACAENGEPFWRLWADVLLAYIGCDLKAFPGLFAEAGNWGMNDTNARVGALWLRACRKAGNLEEPERIARLVPHDPFVRLELALHHQACGRHDEALELLESARGGYGNREFRQHFHAAAFMIGGDPAELDALLQLSAHPERLVRYVLLPLASLPRDRPELALRYPLQEVLESGWKEAIELRHGEIPRLQLNLLGGFNLRHLGAPLQLPARQQQILSLLALGAGRDRIAADLWPEATSASSGNNLNVQLHMLRKTLEPWGLPTYLADGALTNADVDVQQLRQALSGGDAAAVLALYRGDLVPELDTAWLVAERDALKHQVVQLLVTGSAAVEAREAIPMLERVLELEPLNDEAVGLLTTRLIAVGRRNAARRLLHDYGRLLARETGLQPTADLLSLLEG